MARPRSHSDDHIRQAYETTRNTREMARSLKLSTVSAYKHIRRLGLKPKAPEGRSDLRKFDDDRFMEVYSESVSVQEIAQELKCTVATVRKHMKRLGLEGMGQRVMTPELRMRLFNSYAGNVTVRDLTLEHGISPGSVRNAFDRVLRDMWNSPKPPPYPMPDCHGQIKVYHLIRRFSRVANQPASSIASTIGVPQHVVKRYLDRVAAGKEKHVA